MADQPLTEMSLPDAGPTLPPQLGPLPGDDENRLKSDLIDEIFGVPELAPSTELCAGPPEPEPDRASLRTSLEEEPPAENLEAVALNLEHALSGIFDEVEGTSAGAAPAAAAAAAGDGGSEQVVSNGQPESAEKTTTESPPEGDSASPATAASSTAAPAAADDDDDIVVLDEIPPVAVPAVRRKPRLLGPASRRKPTPLAAGMSGKLKGILRGPASKRKDFALLGPPSSRMPVEIDSSDSEGESPRTPEEIKMMNEARRLKVRVGLRLNNVCLETSQTARQWAVTLLQRRDARKRHWEEVRRGPRPAPTPRRSSRPRARGGRHAAQPPPPAALAHTPPVDFAATKQLMSLINRGVMQMTSVGGAPPMNGRPRVATLQRGRGRSLATLGPGGPAGRGRVMVQIPAGSLQQRHLAPVGRAGLRAGATSARPGDRVIVRPTAGVADLAAIPDLGEKQRTQLMKLLQGNNGTSISPSVVEPPRAPQMNRRARPAAAPARPAPARPAEPAPPPPEPDQPRLVPEYCRTTSGSPDDLFSVYLSAPQQPEKCFVNMQINNHCLKVRLPARPSATGMVFAQVTRRAMEPVCQITVGSTTFTPPTLAGLTPALAARPGPKSRQQPAEKPTHACPKCSHTFPSASMLEYHFKAFHTPAPAEAEPAVYDCPLCPRWTGPFALLRDHLAAVHAPRGAANFTCAVCGRAWGRRTADAHGLWSRHVISHAKPRTSQRPPAGRRATRPVAAVASSPRTQPVASSPRTQPVASSPRTQRVASSPRTQRVASSPRTQPAASGHFPCPQCNAVFADVSKFPEHWLKAHAGGGAAVPAAPAAAPAAVRSMPVRRAARPRADVGRETRFSARFNSEAAPTPVATAATTTTTPADSGGTLRCTRCRELFPDEAAYAQHWINAHTRIRLSADQQAAASRAVDRSVPAVAADPVSASDVADGASADTAEGAAAAGASNGDADGAMEEGDGEVNNESAAEVAADAADAAEEAADSAPAPDTPHAAVVDSVMDVAEDDAGAGADVPVEPAAGAGGDSCADASAGVDSSVTEQNGVGGLAVDGGAGEPTDVPMDPVEEAAALVPSQADFELSEETLDKMLQEIVPSKVRK